MNEGITEQVRRATTRRGEILNTEQAERMAREVRHAEATVWPDGDSWIRGYAEDVKALLRERYELRDEIKLLRADRDMRIRERDEAVAAYRALDASYQVQAKRAEKAEANRDALAEALRFYAELGPDDIPYNTGDINDPPDVGAVARAALAVHGSGEGCDCPPVPGREDEPCAVHGSGEEP